ncbi:trypsin-like peptidase domain-containing protein [Streptomyces marispadix]|uniref:Trypsin-like peptidase domain-containing protein n=1 Tax=Streptomyces marispadix TaxID=2922868 RepID=A0ABS9SWF6_9ACTN|nr:trypsin-like peptidase domain-containing protein [Streptomyces marispadix]MCH6160538.1 trypsin-like peptidase domain-containing protein [Streptomyces marispadix]
MANAEPAERPAPDGDRPWTELPNGRTAEIIVSRQDGGQGRGSGHLVASGVVLTCAHVVQGASSVQVRFNAEREQERKFEASTAWDHSGIDVAVLTFEPGGDRAEPHESHEPREPHEPGEPGDPRASRETGPQVRPESFARIGDQAVRLGCEAKGFPLFKYRPPPEGPLRDVAHIQAECVPHANSRTRTLELEVVPAPDPAADPRPPEDREGRYMPWSGMSGAVVFSGGRIIGVVTEHHPAEGGRLTASRVDTWKQLVADDDRFRHLEELLGSGSLDPAALPDAAAPPVHLPEGVRTHRQELANGINQRKYLTNRQVPFVSPGETHEADPENLLDRLSAMSTPGSRPGDLGVVLVGAAGSGKTRTCFEVAEKAHERGWSVLHVGREATASAEELADAVAALHSRGEDVLLVLDYLDRYTDLDHDFANKVEDRRTSRARLACIASLRPGAVQNVEDREQLRLFETIEVCQEESHQQSVTRGIVAKAAPAAVYAYGTDEVAAVCGTRPVLALLIARAIEYRVLDGEEDVLPLPGLRNDRDLSYWLKQRTREDFGDARTGLLASAVAAAACTQHSDAVHDAVAAFLERHGDRDFTGGDVGVVGHLRDLGWLLESDGELDVLHDFVADELLQQALLPTRTRLEGATAATMFSAFLVSLRTFRLAAGHIRRWSTDLETGKREDVRRVCDNWLRREGAEALARLAADEADLAESGRMLLALLSGPPWQSGAVAAWDRLVTPWLKRAEDAEYAEEGAAHLAHTFLADAVRNTSDSVPERLSAAALTWTEEHPDRRRETRTVLEALLRAPGLCADHRAEAARRAVDWLGAHGTTWAARPLALTETLLTRDDLPEGTAEEAVRRGLDVAESHLPVPATAHVLDAVLRVSRRPALQPGPRERVLVLALRWVRRHPGSDAASFVLAPLLQQPDLDDARTQAVFDRSLDWLGDRRTAPLATFVLRHLLKHPALTGKRLGNATGIAMDWLAERGGDRYATFLLTPLLLRSDHGQDTGTLVALGLDWLKAHHHREEAHFLLRAVLEQPRLPEGAPESAAAYARAWLGKDDHGVTENARSVLSPLLKRRELSHTYDHCAAALRWLGVEANLGSEQASFVLGPLLNHPALGPHTRDAGKIALRWLDRHPQSENVSYVLGPLLSLYGFDGDCEGERAGGRDGEPGAVGRGAEATGVRGGAEAGGVGRGAEAVSVRRGAEAGGGADPVALGFDWLAGHGTSPAARFVLAPLLRPDRAGARAAPSALAWLGTGDNSTLNDALYVLERLLTCPGLDSDLTSEAVAHALDWLDVHHASPGALRVREPLLRGPLTELPLRDRTVTRVLDCAGHGHLSLSGSILRRLLDLGPLSPGPAAALARSAWERADAQASKGALETLAWALGRDDVPSDALEKLADLALQRLDGDQLLSNSRTKLLRALLSRTDLDATRSAEAVSRALAWLDARGDVSFAGVILGLLLRRRDVIGRTGPPGTEAAPGAEGGHHAEGGPGRLVATAFEWLGVHATHPYAADVLCGLLEASTTGGSERRGVLTSEQEAECVRLARAWFEEADLQDRPAGRRLAELMGGRG